MTRRTVTTSLITGLLVLSLAACGDADDGSDISGGEDPVVDDGIDPANPAGGACLEGDEDCYETGAEGDALPIELLRQEAHGLLGMTEDDLGDDVRVARRNDEVLALTEDDVVGRRTVELEDTDGGGLRVVRVTLELPDGPETYDLVPG